MVPGEEPETYKRIYEPNYKTPIERNQKYTAHRSPSLLSKTGWGITALRSRHTKFLRGDIPPDELVQCTEGAQAIIEALQQEIAPPNFVDIHITPDDLRAGYKAWRETTATSPSGQHLGYYKAIAAFERTPEDGDSPRRL
jgi:hypothetical protein